MKNNIQRGYTLIELVVAIGLFAIIMMLASGAYLMMMNINRQTQAVATGIDNLSFALETMARDIRTGTTYNCDALGNCPNGGFSFSFTNTNGVSVTYARGTQSGLNGSVGDITKNGVVLTDSLVNVTALTFYVTGAPKGDGLQPHVTIVVSGTVSSGPNKTEAFTVETGATMRGTDI